MVLKMSETNHIAFVDENSPHDRILNLLAVIALISILAVGIYWQFLPLPVVSYGAEQSEK
jgi:hypothetical protein